MALDLRQNSFLLNILRTNCQNFTKLYICIHNDKIYVGIVTHAFLHIFYRVTDLNLCQNFVYDQYLESIHIDRIYVGIVTPNFSHIFTRVMALYLRPNFVSAQHHKNKLTDFNQI